MIDIRFANQAGNPAGLPAIARGADLPHRFAVIQDTYDPDGVDMVFDAPLWLALVEFAQGYGDVSVVEHLRPASWIGRLTRRSAPTERPLADFLRGWSAEPDEEKDPPALLVARSGGKVTLCVATEYWQRVGGPAPFHDSYTYVVCSPEPVDEQVKAFIASRADAGRWRLPD